MKEKKSVVKRTTEVWSEKIGISIRHQDWRIGELEYIGIWGHVRKSSNPDVQGQIDIQ